MDDKCICSLKGVRNWTQYYPDVIKDGKCTRCGKETPSSKDTGKPDEAVVVPQADIDRLGGLRNERDELVRRLWCVFKGMSELLEPDDFTEEDLELWQQVTLHSGVQNRLDDKQVKGDLRRGQEGAKEG